MRSELWITKKSIDYSTQKLTKWGVALLRGSFDLENGSFSLRGPTSSIAKVLTDVHEKIQQK
ncbi:hypothetical protein H5410_049208 [Solanum commersonii]|uniref:Uncharacterized protein n=1 Tax=Solanum commersonii TaxID=4109 RepID=A0A9J5XP30_SOLCO|nr:hypothetical protein H5410_049208 [Solanum commersonii]